MLSYFYVIVGTVSTIFDIKVFESDVHHVIFINLQQPFAVLIMWIIEGIIGCMNDAGVHCKSSTTSQRNAFVACFKTARIVQWVSIKRDEHLVTRTGVDNRFIRVT